MKYLLRGVCLMLDPRGHIPTRQYFYDLSTNKNGSDSNVERVLNVANYSS